MLPSLAISIQCSANEGLILGPGSIALPDVSMIPGIEQLDNVLRRVRILQL